VTDRNQRATSHLGRVLQRVVMPLLLVSATTLGAASLQQASVSTPLSAPSGAATPTAARRTLLAAQPGLGQDDPRLSMPALQGQAPDGLDVSSIRVLPAGNVPTTPIPVAPSGDAVSTSRTRWVRNAEPTTLWSGANVADAAFTDLPAGSYLRVEGPRLAGRVPVFYAGDRLLRQPGDGWVDDAAVQTVDAPAPGEVPAVDAAAREPLPVWVQSHTATTLWSGPDDQAVQLTDLPQWTFLKVAGITRGGRLLVNFAGDYATRQPGIGWVDQSAVGPAGDPGVWVTNHRATALWSGTDDRAAHFTDLAQWTKLRIVEGAPADANRLEVEFFGDGAARQPGMAWIARADVGPITPPVPLPARAVIQSTTSGSALAVESHTFASQDDFINTVGAAAQRSFKKTGVPASVTVAQAILESDWGRSRLTRQGNNLFGIKALGGPGPAGVVSLATWEHQNGSDVVVQAPFKAYVTLEQSIDDHGQFFVINKRYANALANGHDPRAFAQAIQDDGYATDPSYAAKLTKLMDRYNLYRFDT